MKYWESFFLTLGVGCFVGAVITPESWLATPVAFFSTWFGWYLHKKGVQE